MNRYEILIGKEPEEGDLEITPLKRSEAVDDVLKREGSERSFGGIDVGTGDSAVVTIRDSEGNVLDQTELENQASSLPDFNIPDQTIYLSVQTARFRVPNRNGDSFEVGDLVCADQEGVIRPCVPGGFEPVGAVVDTSTANSTADIQILTMDQLVNQEAINEAIAQRYQRIQEQRAQDEADSRNEAQRAPSEYVSPFFDYHYFNDPPVEGVSGATGAHPSHIGELHEHPKMQRNLKVPRNHVIVDRNEWHRARRRGGNR